MLDVRLFQMQTFLPMPYEDALAPRLKLAHEKLQNGSGIGGDFTGWVHLPRDYDKEEFARIKAAAARIQSNSKALVVIGIGGSYLGARGVIECLCSPNYNLKKKNTPNIYFVGNGLSSDSMQEVVDLLGDDDFTVNVISKSGTTTEPAVAFRFFRKLLEEKYGREGARERIIATTDKSKGALKSLADAEGWETFVVPDEIGGRYSVLTAVGLLPIAAAGIDIEYRSDRVLKIRSRFMNPEEEASLDREHEAEHLLLHWCAKETLFKMIGREEVDFLKHLHVRAFPYAEEGSFWVQETRTEAGAAYILNYLVAPDFVLTWSFI